jgi:hypothetical protein
MPSLQLDRMEIMEVQVVILITAVFLTIIGLYLSIISWFSWRGIEDDVMRAKAFLNKKFLNRNFNLVLIIGAFVGLHTLLEFIEILGYPSALIPFAKEIRLFYFLTLTISMILLVVLAYCWYKLVCYQKPTIIKTPQEIIEEKRIKNPLLNPDEKTLFG